MKILDADGYQLGEMNFVNQLTSSALGKYIVIALWNMTTPEFTAEMFAKNDCTPLFKCNDFGTGGKLMGDMTCAFIKGDKEFRLPFKAQKKKRR